MQIYFLRHSDPFPKGPKYREDSLRPLTSEGKKQAKLIARFLQGIQFDVILSRNLAINLAARFLQGIQFDVILSSPYVRAEQTAQVLADRLGAKIKIAEELSPGFNLSKLPGLIASYKKSERVILVGHEPDFSDTVKKMVGGKAELEIRKGGLAVVEVEVEKS